ncbi:MAG: IS21 family transposase [Litoreibacter sp.]
MKSMTRRVVELLLCPNETNASISRKVEKHRDTIRNMRTNLGLSGLSKPELNDLGDAALEELIVGKKKQKPRFLEPDLNAILLELRKPGVTRELLFEEYLAAAAQAGPEELGPMAKTSFFTRIREHKEKREPEFRHDHLPGERLQFDFSGKRPSYFDKNGKKVVVELAVSVLPFSVMTFAVAIRSQRLPDSVEAVVKALEYFGGTPNGIVVDNFKAAVSTPRRGNQPAIMNTNFLAMLDHYGVYPDPARSLHARDKGMGENAVKQIQYVFLGKRRNQHYSSLEELNAELLLAVNELNDRPMKGHNGLSRRQIFNQLERDSLRPLPKNRYEYGDWRIGITVPKHYYILADGVEYSVPHRLIGSRVNIKSSTLTVEVYGDGKIVAIHLRAEPGSGRVTDVSHLPANHQAMSSYKRENVLRHAERLGDVVEMFAIRHMEAHKNVKATGDMCQNIERKMREHGREKVEAAIVETTERGQIHAAAIYTIIERGEKSYATPLLPRPAAPSGNVRGADYYQSDGEA